jgi:two-component system LytT family response regulator
MNVVQRRVLIVDDEEPGRINLRYALAGYPAWQLAGECADAATARTFLETGHVDLVLLDIHMPCESGLQLARELSAQAQPPLIVFVTAYDAYAVEAFALYALDYLLKPIDDDGLARALSRVEALIEQRQLAAHANALRAWAASGIQPAEHTGPSYLRQLNVRSVGRIDSVRLEDVMWVEAAGNYVELHMKQRRVLHRVPIGTLERHLDPACFVRVHRSALVRVDQLATLNTGVDGVRTLLLRCGSAVPVSERYLGKVLELLGAA